MQPKKHPEDYSKRSMGSEDGQFAPEELEALDYTDKSRGALKVPDGRLQKRSRPAGLDYEELGGLSDLGQQDCSSGRNILE